MSRGYSKNGRLFLEPSEQKDFLKAVLRSDNLREKCFCLVFVYTGCRMGEALELRPEHIEAEKCLINFETLKQKDDYLRRIVGVPDYVMTLLIELIATQDGGRLFDFSRWTRRRIIRKYMKLAGLDGFKANTTGLRRAFAIGQSLEGGFVTDIQKWLGHKNLKTTQIYLEYNDFDGERERIKKGWPDIGMDASISHSATIVTTEVQFFDFNVKDIATQISKINSYIKNKAINGFFC